MPKQTHRNGLCHGDSDEKKNEEYDYEISGSLELTSRSNTVSCTDFADDELSTSSLSLKYTDFYFNGLNEFKSLFFHASLSLQKHIRQFVNSNDMNKSDTTIDNTNTDNTTNGNGNYYVENGI